MQRPDLTTLACVNADCQHYRRPAKAIPSFVRSTVKMAFVSYAVAGVMKSSLNDAIPPCSTRK